jgi:pimeloyl-ACP methyl ester carboxylesterase
MVLNATNLGEVGSPVAFCHGLFGQGKNWTQIARALSQGHRVLLLDMPDHGRSPRSERFDFVDIADRVVETLGPEPTALVGHSMGGKVAMLAALRHPERVSRLAVVDVAPVGYPHAEEFARYIAAMQAIDLSSLTDRGDADAALSDAVPDDMVRGFLLQSLRRTSVGWEWLLNLDLLARDLDRITDWPREAVADLPPYPGPVLWIGGGRSPYVRHEHVEAMDALFPLNRRITVKDAGHWVHAERPEIMVEALRRFLG